MSTPLYDVLSRVKVTQRNDRARTYSARCPAHDDKHASLSITEGDDGRVLLNCFAGCSVDDIARAMGLQIRDLFPTLDPVRPVRKTLRLGELAQAKGFDAKWLGSLGVVQKGTRVQITYRLADGSLASRQRFRIDVVAKEGSYWGKGEGSPVPYGLWKLENFRESAGYLILVEGESDAWTLWKHGFPALGIPGADLTGSLDASHVQGFSRIYILQEPDKGGDTFKRRMAERLRAVRWKGELFTVPMPPATKDPNALYLRDRDGFEAAFQQLLDTAYPATANPIGGDGAAVGISVPAAGPDVASTSPEEPAGDQAVSHGHTSSFWTIETDRSGREVVKIDRSRLVDWYEEQGFAKVYEYDRETSTKVRRRGLVMHRYSDEQIKDHALHYARGLEDKRVLGALRRGANIYLGNGLFDCFKPIRPKFQQEMKTTAYFYFKNGFVEVTADSLQLLSYDQLRGHIWAESRSSRSVDVLDAYDESDVKQSVFGQFMWMAMKKDSARMRTLMSTIGYLLHGHKNPAEAKAIIFMDEIINDNPSGRAGKGLVAQALGHLTPTVHMDARRIDLGDRFAFQAVIPGVTRILHFNDASERFPFDKLFSAITEGLGVEKKGGGLVNIPFAESPKFLISTNYVIGGRGGSHNARVFEVEFGDYFNEVHTPKDEFGHVFFDEWDAAEWNRFDNLMLRCVQLYLQEGLIPYKHVNIGWKKLVQDTCPEFGDFVQAFPFEANAAGTLIPQMKTYQKKGLVETFASDYRREISPHILTKWLAAYAEYRGWEMKNRLGKDKDQIAFIDRSGL